MKLHADHFLDRLSRGGVLLTTKADDKINTMTIGWGSISNYWGKPVVIVPVRKSRYTHELIEKSNEFTLSVPKFNELAKQLAYCGSNSGRDVDKFTECNLDIAKSKSIDTPIIKQAYLHYECKILSKVDMTDEHMQKDICDKWYVTNDYHTLYFGEITKCYITD